MEVTCPAQTLQQLSRESLLYTWGPSCRVNSLPNRSTVSFADHNVYTTQKMQNALKPHLRCMQITHSTKLGNGDTCFFHHNSQLVCY